uniref:Sulfotransferase n=1 Tax=Nelumbo nucifera TaxID=4432 RepID=A0A822YKN3_NELNU|nr:TPA_asm: hypothetical protein HUJ06_010386 [Nelumbo nucifera]
MTISDSLKPLLRQLPRETWWDEFDRSLPMERLLVRSPTPGSCAAVAARSHFGAGDDDVIVASMKTGTTWLEALKSMFTMKPPTPCLSATPSPRLFHTHMPYRVLPESIKNSQCKIAYITRNPKDTLIVSLWHFKNKSFFNGVHAFGPFFDHVLEYWKESMERPYKILFLKLVSFLGKPFAKEEEVDKLLWMCSLLDRLKNMEMIPNSCFFRLGEIGDWKNHFTPEMGIET